MIKLASIELNKEYLIAKGKNVEIEERIKANEKKYENLWQESKNRYESLSLVQNLLQRKNKAQTLYDGLVACKLEIESLEKSITIKKNTAFELDKTRILELAKYVSHEMKRKKNIIQEKSLIILELTNEISAIRKEYSNVNKFTFDSIKNKNNTQMCQDVNTAYENSGNLDKTSNDEHFLVRILVYGKSAKR